MRWRIILALFVGSIASGDQCQITGPLVVGANGGPTIPVTINGCTYSSSLPSNSTSYIQNTLSPTTTTQAESVATASISTETVSSSTITNLSITTLDGVTPGLIAGTNITSITGAWPNQTINAATQAGGGGGASALAFAIGSTTSWKTQISSPSNAGVWDQSQFNGQALGSGSTAYFSIAYSTNAQTSSYLTTSTDTLIMANCGSACTVTLSTPTYSGKVYMVVQAGTGNVTLAPATASATISGGGTALMNQRYSELDVVWDGSNWWVK